MNDVKDVVKVLDEVSQLVADGVALVKHGGIKSVSKIFDLLAQVKKIVADAPLALPELQHLDAGAAAQITAAVYADVKLIIDAVKA